MNSIGERVKFRREQLQISQEDLAIKLGYKSRSSINKIEKDGRELPQSKILAIAKALSTTPSYIMGWFDTNGQPIQDLKPKGIRINVYGSVPVEAIEDIVDWEEIPTEWTKGGQEYIALKVKGDSMFPKYLDGDTVIIRLQPDCESGQNCVVYVNGYDATLKKVVKKTDCIILQPLNPTYDPIIHYFGNEEESMQILGVVVELRRKE